MPALPPLTPFAPFEPGRRGVPDPSVVVRPARGDDVDAIGAVAASRGPERRPADGRLEAWLADTARLVVVAERGAGAVVGWAMVGPWSGAGAQAGPHVSALTVHPDHRRCGVGDRLLAALEDWAWPRSDRLWSVVNARNDASLALHRRRGFVAVRRIASYAGMTFEDGWGMLLRAGRPDAAAQEEAT